MEKTNNREWVKNAAIIFLAVLLVLTFFSNTIMNHSLPEVATQSVTGGSIVARVRGTGTVTANGSHQVKAEGTRKIQTVMVKVGQKVETGDVLFTLGEGASEEIEAAEKNLRTLQASYNRTAANGPIASYAADSERLRQTKQRWEEAEKALEAAEKAAKEALTDQTADLERRINNKQIELDTLKSNIEALQITLEEAEVRNADQLKRLEELNAERAKLVAELENLPVTEENPAITAKRNEILQKTTRLEEVQQWHDDLVLMYGNLEALKSERDILSNDINNALNPDNNSELNRQLAAILEQINQIETAEAEIYNLNLELTQLQAELESLRAQYEGDVVSLNSQISVIDEQINALVSGDVTEARKALEEAEASKKELEEELETLKFQYQTLLTAGNTPQSESYKYYLQARDEAYLAYMSALDSVSYTMASTAQQQNIQAIELQGIQADIDAAKKKLADLLGGEDAQVTAKVSGTILTVDATAGDTKQKGDVLCSIEVPDMGYSLSFSVTNDQAARLRIGDTATVSNFYWGSEITATLNSIKIDQKNPQTNKTLTFDLIGNVTAGSELTLSVGQKSANYDLIVPSSAIRTDSNGTFVLRVDAKNSPLGNRYIARRVGVEVLASDDNNSAVTADLSNGDYVITTSSAPIKSGEQVRLSAS